MAIGEASGESRATDAAQIAIASPLLDIDISGARGVLFNITGGTDLTLFEVNEAADIISRAAHPEANIIFGAVQDPNFDGKVKITVIATGFDSVAPSASISHGRGQPASVPQSHQYAQARPEYDRSRLYQASQQPISSVGGNGYSSPGQARQPSSQGYGAVPVSPPPVNVSNHPTGPLQAASQPQAAPAQYTPSVLSETSRQRAHVPPHVPGQIDAEQDDFDLDAESAGSPYGHKSLPVPEPEAQPLQRPPSGTNQQRPIRRLDRSAAEGSRGNRNVPYGDVIDIPAFLRKR
jgi:cell division protein FtsZ